MTRTYTSQARLQGILHSSQANRGVRTPHTGELVLGTPVNCDTWWSVTGANEALVASRIVDIGIAPCLC